MGDILQKDPDTRPDVEVLLHERLPPVLLEWMSALYFIWFWNIYNIMITCKIFFWQCASFLINMAILFLSSKRATTVPNKLIDGQYYKQLRRKTLTAFHSLLHFTLTTTWLNLSFLKTLNYSKTIQYWYYLFATPTDFIQMWQKLRQLFGKKFISNQWPIWNFQMRLLTMQNLSFHS